MIYLAVIPIYQQVKQKKKIQITHFSPYQRVKLEGFLGEKQTPGVIYQFDLAGFCLALSPNAEC